MPDEEKIKQDGVKLIEEFSNMLKKVPDTEETHYVVELNNVTRQDGEPVKKKNFPEGFKKINPRTEEGYVIAEKGTR